MGTAEVYMNTTICYAERSTWQQQQQHDGHAHSAALAHAHLG